ncbi:acyl-CoA thioesterase, partial [Brachyspira hampsonii]|nr:acyl-CoA thioesterase [Brachyspira hampsonii]
YTFYDENNKIISKSSTLQMPIDSETRKGFLNNPKDFIDRIEKINNNG